MLCCNEARVGVMMRIRGRVRGYVDEHFDGEGEDEEMMQTKKLLSS